MNYHLDLKLVSLSTVHADPTVIHLVLSSAQIVFPVSTMIRAVAQGGGGGSVAPPDDLWLPSSLQHCLPLDLPKLSEKVTSAGCFQEICPELLSYLLS